MLVNNIKKALHLWKNEGIINGTRIIKRKLVKQKLNVLKKRDVISFYSYVSLPERKPELASRSPQGKNRRLAWFIPDFGIGSGGHLNIFRFIYLLENLGFDSDIYIIDNSQWGHPEKIREIVHKYFFKLNSNFYILKAGEIQSVKEEYDYALATSWQTAYFVRAFANCRKKAYFVQDFEPYFYAKGSSYSFAEATYYFGFYGITAGDWLKEKLEREYNMRCHSFKFSYDKDLYRLNKRREEDARRVFFYSRPPTERRGFELGLMALDRYCKNNPDVEVIMAGWDVSEYEIPFKHFNAGVVRIEELSDLYSQCDCALILSFTNLSLLPLELLASGCSVIINEGHNNSWIDENKKLFIYTTPDATSISNTLEEIMNKREHYQQQAIRQAEFIQSITWEEEARLLGNNLMKALEE